jgi:hypothetical protein
LPNEMSCRLKVWREFDAIIFEPVVLILRHEPRIPALGAAPHPGAAVASPPAGFRHVELGWRVTRDAHSPDASGSTRALISQPAGP